MIPHLLHILLRFSVNALSFQGLFFILIFIIRLREEKLFFVCDVWRGYFDINKRCLHNLPDFATDLPRDFEFQFGEKFSCCVDWAREVCYFEIELQHLIEGVLQTCWNSCRLKQTGTDLLPVETILGCDASHKMWANSIKAV